MLVDQDVLNKVWDKWLVAYSNQHRGVFYENRDYTRVSRRSALAVKFEAWLWENGAGVRRANKKCYLEFHTEDDATVFVLRYS